MRREMAWSTPHVVVVACEKHLNTTVFLSGFCWCCISLEKEMQLPGTSVAVGKYVTVFMSLKCLGFMTVPYSWGPCWNILYLIMSVSIPCLHFSFRMSASCYTPVSNCVPINIIIAYVYSVPCLNYVNLVCMLYIDVLICLPGVWSVSRSCASLSAIKDWFKVTILPDPTEPI